MAKSMCGSSERTCSVCSSGVRINWRSLRCANCDMPPSRKASSYQKNFASSQARPTLSASPKVMYSQAGSSIRSILPPTRLPTARTLATSWAIGARPQPWILKAG